MAYATLAQLKARLGSNVSATAPGAYDQLTDRITAVTANDTEGNAALDYADGLINTAANVRYAVPVVGDATAAAFLRELCLDIAEYHLWKSNAKGKTIPERVSDSFEDATKMLDDIAAGDRVIPSATVLTTATGSGAVADGDDRVFTSDNLGALL